MARYWETVVHGFESCSDNGKKNGKIKKGKRKKVTQYKLTMFVSASQLDTWWLKQCTADPWITVWHVIANGERQYIFFCLDFVKSFNMHLYAIIVRAVTHTHTDTL